MFGLLLSLTIFGISQAIPAPGHGVLAGYCKSSNDCAADECCMSFTQPRGKRFFVDDLSPELMRLVDGYCHKRAAKNETCIMPGGLMPQYKGVYYDCPCAAGLQCQSTGMLVMNKGEGGICSESPSKRSIAPRPCQTGSDCGPDECCVSNIRPIGKRQLGGGHCMPMGVSGMNCYVSSRPGKPSGIGYACPCSNGLTCHGSGLFEVPLGEVGTCGV